MNEVRGRLDARPTLESECAAIKARIINNV